MKPNAKRASINFAVRALDGTTTFRRLVFRPQQAVGSNGSGAFTVKPSKTADRSTPDTVTMKFTRGGLPLQLVYLYGASRHRWLLQNGDDAPWEVTNDEVETLTGQGDLFIKPIV